MSHVGFYKYQNQIHGTKINQGYKIFKASRNQSFVEKTRNNLILMLSGFLDDISQDDNNCDLGYVLETPQNIGRKSIKRHHLKRHILYLDHFPFQKPKAKSLLKRKKNI